MILEVRGVFKRYQMNGIQVEALRGVDFKLNAGEMVGIVGPSGAGKSTFLHIIGLLERPTEGEVLLMGQHVHNLSEEERSRLRLKELGFVFQFHHLLPEFTACENVALPALILGKGRREAYANAADLLTRLGLGNRLHHKPGELSGGEQQRVAFARALINSPRIILADEPTGNLDATSADQLKELLTEFCRQEGSALVLVTHNLQIVRDLGRVLYMRDGRWQMAGEEH